MREFLRRVAFAAVAIPAVAGVVWLGGYWLAVVLAVIAALCAWEYYKLGVATGVRPFAIAGTILASLIPIVAHTNRFGPTSIPPVSAGALVVLVVFAAAIWWRAGEHPRSAVAVTVFGAAYTGGMLTFGYLIRYHDYVIDAAGGLALVGLPLLLTWATDTGGYVFGKWLGKTKLSPTISPGKTVAGAIGGVVLAVVAAGAYVALVLKPVAHLTFTPARLVVFAVVLSAVAQIGDLAESVIKREAGVKDSSNLIPGHGGALDRLDSLLFVLPVAYVLLSEMLVVAP